MIEENHNRIAKIFFDIYIKQKFKNNFEGLYLINYEAINSFDLNADSVILTPNHFSWWDGFFAYFFNEKILKKKFHILVIQETIKKYPFFRYLGAFGINQKNNKDALILFNYLNQKLKYPENLIVFYPQGKLEPFESENISFQKGLEYFIKKFEPDNILMQLAFMIRYEHFEKPIVYAKIGKIWKCDDIINNFDYYYLTFKENLLELKEAETYNKKNFFRLI